MAIETPNRLTASIVFYFAEENAEPPAFANPATITITAINGITALQVVDEDPNDLDDGFFLVLQEKIRPEHGAFFMSGIAQDTAQRVGFTPFAELSGDPNAVQFETTEGDFLCYEPVLPSPFGQISVACWSITPTNTPLPVSIPVS